MASVSANLDAARPRLRVPAAAWTPAIAAIVVFAAMAARTGVLNDGDTYWHLAAGRWMLAHQAVLGRDVFSYTAVGAPWVAHEWLSEAAMALAWTAGGWSGLLLLFAVAGAATAWLLADTVSRHLNPLSAAATLALSLNLAAHSLLARPHLLALVPLAICARELLAAREAGRAPGIWLAGVIGLWANLHGSFVFGFLLLGAFGLEALVESPAADRFRTARGWAAVAALALLAAAATPHGVDGLIQPFQIMGMSTLQAIDEWKPSSLTGAAPLAVALYAVLGVGLLRGVRVPLMRLALLLVVLFMAIQHMRHLIVLAVVAPMLLAEPLGRALGPRRPAAANRTATAALALAIVAAAGLRLAIPARLADGPSTPVTALAHVPTEVARRPVLNAYGFGGYLIFTGRPVFIDGRADMYGDAFVRRYLAIWNGEPGALDAALTRYGVGWTLLEPGSRLAREMDARPGWRRVYADRYAVVHARAD